MFFRRGNDLGSGRRVTALDRTLRRAAGLVYGLEECVRTAAERGGTGAWRTGGDAVWADVREAGHPHYRGQFAASEGTCGAGAWHASGSTGKETAAGITNYDQANAYLEKHYLAEHNRRYGHAAVAAADYHRRRPTARQLDEVFWLEEERVVSEDWVVRYHNRLLQLERQSQHWAPARSRVLVRENEVGEVAIHYRDHRVGFREWKASTALGERRGPAPSPAPPSPNRHRPAPPTHPWKQGWQKMRTPTYSLAWQ